VARRDTIRTTASVDGTPLGEFETFTGGELTSEDIKHARGAGQPEQAKGGRQTVGNVTIAREYNADSDDLHWLSDRRGKGDMVVTRQPLDDDYNPKGRPIVYSGKLMRVAPGESDVNSGDIDSFELEMSCNGRVG
jgi:hypothetical protein